MPFLQWQGFFVSVAQQAGFSKGTSTAPSHQVTTLSLTSHSSPAASEVQKRVSNEQPSCSARGALHLHRAGLKPSTARIGNFQNPSLYSPKQAFESHIPQQRLYLFFTYISYISPTYEAQALLLGFVCRRREAGKTVRDNPHGPQLISSGKFICLPLKINLTEMHEQTLKQRLVVPLLIQKK